MSSKDKSLKGLKIEVEKTRQKPYYNTLAPRKYFSVATPPLDSPPPGPHIAHAQSPQSQFSFPTDTKAEDDAVAPPKTSNPSSGQTGVKKNNSSAEISLKKSSSNSSPVPAHQYYSLGNSDQKLDRPRPTAIAKRPSTPSFVAGSDLLERAHSAGNLKQSGSLEGRIDNPPKDEKDGTDKVVSQPSQLSQYMSRYYCNN